MPALSGACLHYLEHACTIWSMPALSGACLHYLRLWTMSALYAGARPTVCTIMHFVKACLHYILEHVFMIMHHVEKCLHYILENVYTVTITPKCETRYNKCVCGTVPDCYTII
jgi:hypothetical protein